MACFDPCTFAIPWSGRSIIDTLRVTVFCLLPCVLTNQIIQYATVLESYTIYLYCFTDHIWWLYEHNMESMEFISTAVQFCRTQAKAMAPLRAWRVYDKFHELHIMPTYWNYLTLLYVIVCLNCIYLIWLFLPHHQQKATGFLTKVLATMHACSCDTI